ncbi:MAG TPA: hypothetical protein VHS06_11190 [Chloroflexota bacterium]|nr:hypothetical protein [Chloroflexota bacterium]
MGVAGPRGRLTQERQLRDAIGQVALQMAEQLDWDKVVETVLHVTSTALGADAVIIWNVDVEARLLHLAASWGVPEPRVRPLRHLSFDSPLMVARAVHEGRVQMVERLDELPSESPRPSTMDGPWVSERGGPAPAISRPVGRCDDLRHPLRPRLPQG